MARVQTIQTNFTAGELSPRLLGRVDIARYNNGARVMENMYPLIHGGATRRPGFKFVAEVRYSTKRTRLIPLIFSTTQAYVLEFGDGYMRVFQSGGQMTLPAQAITGITNANPAVLTYSGADTYANGDEVFISGVVGAMAPFVNGRNFVVVNVNTGANTFQLDYLDGTNVNSTTWGAYGSGGTVAEVYQIASPYLEADLPEIRYAQEADTMFQANPDFAVRKLTRTGHTAWRLDQQVFVVEPHDEIGVKPTTALTLGATSGAGVSCTAAAACFQNADVGRGITDDSGGVAVIVGFTSTTVVTIDITTAFASVSVGSGTWTLTESPKTDVNTGTIGPEGSAITLTAAANAWRNNAQVTDIGRYVVINDGLVEITGVTSALVVTGIIRSLLSVAGTSPSGVWSLETKVWDAANGFPRAVTLFQQRLILAGSNAYPNVVWGSRTALYDDFAEGVRDDDAFEFALVSDQVNAILQIAGLRALIAMSYGSTFSLKGGIEKPLTPTNVQANEESSYGSAIVRPVKVGTELLNVQRGGRRIRAVGYRADTEAFDAPDLTVISEHITNGGISELAYAQEPDSMVCAVRADGVMLTLTLEREQEVVGWARQVTDGEIESVAVIPFGDIDQVWVVVKRVIDGVNKRYIEFAEFQREPDDNAQTDSYLTASLSSFAITVLSWAANVVSVTTASPHGLSVGSSFRVSGAVPTGYNGNFVVATTPSGTQLTYALFTNPGVSTVLGTLSQLALTWSGFWHLEGRTVDVVADGVVFPQKVVTNGQVVLEQATPDIEVGLHYESEIELLSPEVASVQGTSQGSQISVNEVTVRLYRSMGCTIEAGGQTDVIPFRAFGESVLDTPLVAFTGDKRVNSLGWGKTSRVRVRQPQPLPLQVLAVMRKVTVND